MAGIYLHIPFCKQACHYCNFHFSTSLRFKDELVQALCTEITLQKGYLKNEEINTIYFGGGTPSLLSVEDCRLLLATLFDAFSVAPSAEITLEANPDDITTEKLAGWKSLGINRLSIGVQSFFEEELEWMNRAHNATEAIKSLELAVAHFDNITLDLIYGSPLLTDAMWQKNVETVVGLGIPHLSCYALTVEEKTPLHKHIVSNKKQGVDGDKAAHQFLLLMDWLAVAGYQHYEVSNFAKPGFKSKHNSAYWKGVNYLGIGPSAHSYNGVCRQWNVANNQQYTQSVKTGKVPFEEETLTPANQLNEYLMIALRTSDGLDLDRIEKQWGAPERRRVLAALQTHIVRKQVTQNNHRFCLTNTGMLAADGIAANLFTEV